MKQTYEIGDLAEMLVNYQLSSAGLITFAPSAGHLPYDLLVDVRNGSFLRIQVKGSKSPRLLAGRVTQSYVFNTTAGGARSNYHVGDVDWFAFVALDLEKILYVPAETVIAKQNSQFSVTTARFASDGEVSLRAVPEDARRDRVGLSACQDCNRPAQYA